jgi:hypothetical protein
VETKNPRAGSDAEALVSIRADAKTFTKPYPNSQPANTCQLQALRLIARHHVRPELAMTLAGLAYGEAGL